ncbi:hypothetical protein [Pseudofrankia sp. BMG5.37]|uniref:hypothetical protein n=1 Tax=Pseudofrankia sp. BMG5.37 TaxID=3050035 RepID=UPI002895306A|nr:hypothetical protein [Pseudofrankia sp. BMG5.37]MDT3442690.1 hypothetical protein [Pseudofrankia sp. BMG5.37]
MSTALDTEPQTGAGSSLRPVLIGLSVVFLLTFALAFLVFASPEIDAEATGATVLKEYTLGRATLYGDMAIQAFAALIVFWGVSFRRAVGGGTWTSQVGLIGAALLALTLSLFGVTDAAMYHAVQTGIPETAQAINVISNAFFLPLMLSMICLYVGTGLSAWTTGALPKWLAIVSLVLGVLAPLGPAGFVPFTLLPIWVVMVSVLAKPRG